MATKLAKILPLIKGDWSSGRKYEMLDVVVYNGSSYIAKTESFISTTNPSADTTHWQLLASKGSNGGDGVKGPKGDKGDQGPTGAQGATGPTGPTGPTGANGKDGARGPQGLPGERGPAGPQVVNMSNMQVITFAANDSYGIRTAQDNCCKVGDSGQAFYYGYFKNVDINTGNLNFSSDRRVKKNIKNVQETCLDKINKINVKTFDYIDEGQKEYEESKNHIGFIAQEVEEVFPELKETLVTTKDDSENSGIKDRKFLKETKLIFVLWKAVQELSQEVEKLKRGE